MTNLNGISRFFGTLTGVGVVLAVIAFFVIPVTIPFKMMGYHMGDNLKNFLLFIGIWVAVLSAVLTLLSALISTTITRFNAA